MNRLVLFLLALFLGSCDPHSTPSTPTKNADYVRAYDLHWLEGKPDSAFYYYNRAKEQLLTEGDSLTAGKCLVNMSIISTDRGDFFGGLEIGLQSLVHFNPDSLSQHAHLSSLYNNLALATYQLKDFERAYDFYDLALQYAQKPADTHKYMNNKGRAYQEAGEYDKALATYVQVLNEETVHPSEFARILTNYTMSKWLSNNSYNAARPLHKALQIRKQIKDIKGLHSSYAHLSEFYIGKNPDSAHYYAQLRYDATKKFNSPDDRASALKTLIQLSPPAYSKRLFNEYQRLADSIQQARAAAINQFALIRYETEKHKADKLRLQEENTKKQYQIYLAVFVSLVLLTWGYYLYRRRQKRLREQKDTEIKETRIKFERKIHDRVANHLYHLMAALQNSPTMERDKVLDQLEKVYHTSRNISYEAVELFTQDFSTSLSNMLKSYHSEETELFILGNEEPTWSAIPPSARTELYYILQELMINMKKHSKAGSVVIKFLTGLTSLKITYQDDGIGMPEVKFKNGLKSTENRIKNIKGTISFDTTTEKGLFIEINCPFET